MSGSFENDSSAPNPQNRRLDDPDVAINPLNRSLEQTAAVIAIFTPNIPPDLPEDDIKRFLDGVRLPVRDLLHLPDIRSGTVSILETDAIYSLALQRPELLADYAQKLSQLSPRPPEPLTQEPALIFDITWGEFETLAAAERDDRQ